MSQVADPLVGRADEVAVLEEALTGLDEGRPTAIELVGEPGIGKTRLLAELAARADQRGCLVLSGAASELERDLPFGVLVDAMDEYVRSLNPRQLGSLDDEVGAELAEVLPSLQAHVASRDVGLQSERYRSHRAVRDLLERLAAAQPVVLVLDDLHWADVATVEVIGALLRRPPAAGVLLALGARPRQLPELLAAALERAYREGNLVRVELGPLSRAEAGELLGDVDAVAADSWYDESGGNPFFLEQLRRSLDQAPRSGQSGETRLAGVEVPSAVARALTEELSLLSGRARALLEGASVAGDPFEIELAAVTSGISEAEAIEGLDELLRLDLARATDVPRRFRFRHPLVRRATYESVAAGRRLIAHERCAAALEARGSSAATRAHHIEQSARVGDNGAIRVLREAAGAAALRAPASAAGWLGSALRLLPDEAPADARAGLLLEQAYALMASGQLEASRTALMEGLRIAPADAAAQRVHLTATCAGIENMLGRHDEAHARLVAALDDVPEVSSPEAATLMLELAIDALFRTEFDRMREWSLRALDTARSLDDEALTAAALGTLCLADSISEALDEATRSQAEAARMFAAMSDEAVARRLDGLVYLAIAEMYLNRLDESQAHAERAIAIGRSVGFVLPYVFPTLGTVLLMRGALSDAAEVFDAAVAMSELAGYTEGVAWNLFNRSVAAVATGELELAIATANESVELTRALGDAPAAVWAGAALANALTHAGDPARAVEVLSPLTGDETLRLFHGGWRSWVLELLTRAYIYAGDVEGAARAAARAEEQTGAFPVPLARALSSRASAEVALARGDARAAATHALDSAAAGDEIGAVIDAGISRVVGGRALAVAGDEDRAVAELERAAAAFAAFGAERYWAESERELRRLGHTVYRRSAKGRTEDGLASLTERELELARLVVDRKTNPQIAAELFLSQKTVETHLRNIFRKLGVANRVELAKAVEAADRAESLT
jgi:predicted ATPase/DNA-binding CsgD family transcriptional regulator